jgi:hypothetical protein
VIEGSRPCHLMAYEAAVWTTSVERLRRTPPAAVNLLAPRPIDRARGQFPRKVRV